MHTVMIPTDIAAKNIDSLNRSVVAAVDVDNGAVFQLNGISAAEGQGEVFNYLAPAEGAISDLWMAYSPEVVLTVSGDFQAKGIDSDPRNFTNVAGIPFDAFKLQVGDLVKLTADGFANAYTEGNEYAVAVAGSNKLTFAAAAVSGVSFKLLKREPVIIGSGVIGSNAVDGYILECVSIR